MLRENTDSHDNGGGGGGGGEQSVNNNKQVTTCLNTLHSNRKKGKLILIH